ncbi:phage holin family protein [Rhodococcus sp. X156]|uniref:phage holin family protein n=1 Tax=Rhodococcus sp. X156 TaxID=2499145 RepID=UPI000FDAD79D|nr:phage holin family protein [Rhodococcus sp. X156]
MTHAAPHDPDDLSTPQLLERLTDQVSTLVKQEVQHATAEVKQKGARLGVGIGISGAGAVVALYGLGALVACAILALTLVLDAWLAALIIGAALVVLGALMGLFGAQRARKAVPPVPQETLNSVQRDVQTVKENLKR